MAISTAPCGSVDFMIPRVVHTIVPTALNIGKLFYDNAITPLV